jgi:hypothetical protein
LALVLIAIYKYTTPSGFLVLYYQQSMRVGTRQQQQRSSMSPGFNRFEAQPASQESLQIAQSDLASGFAVAVGGTPTAAKKRLTATSL